MNTPLVSIIIPTYNRAHLIGETLDSVLEQTYTNWECIIVDDGSTDNTAKVVQEYVEKDSRFQFFYRPENSIKGASSCRNLGLSYSKGDYIVFLDSDDFLLDYCLNIRVSKIKEFANCNFWVFPMFVQKEDQNKEILVIPPSESYLIDFLSYKVRWGIMCTLWEANFIKKIKGFNEMYPRLNDPEVHIRAMLESQNNFHVFKNVQADTVYMMGLKSDQYKFAQIYGNSLLLFIPDIKRKMTDYGLNNEIKFLKAYLIDYFVKFYSYNTRRNNSRVLKAFYKNKIISFSDYIYFLTVYNLFLVANYSTKKIRENLIKRITNL